MNLPTTFALYLKTQGASPVTIKNYLSDLNHFLGWAEITLKARGVNFTNDEPQTLNRHFDTVLVAKYRHYLAANQLPLSTVNRRLSTLRSFARFCLSQNWLTTNPMKAISNLPAEVKVDENGAEVKLLAAFENYLITEKTSPNTIKNYLADLREFLGFLAAA